jgi:hypothetical protein
MNKYKKNRKKRQEKLLKKRRIKNLKKRLRVKPTKEIKISTPDLKMNENPIYKYLIKKEEIPSKSKGIILPHLTTGDNFTIYALVLELSKRYEELHLFSLKRNEKTLNQMFFPYSNVKIRVIEEPQYNSPFVSEEILLKYYSNYQEFDIIGLGSHNKGENVWFWRDFYLQTGLDYQLRYKEEYSKMYRDEIKENELYTKMKERYGDKYIFIHDHRNYKYQHFYPRKEVHIESDLPIFHPNYNYYEKEPEHPFYSLWSSDFYVDNLFDYGMIMENASEIYINDSTFSCLAVYLNLENINKKILCTKDYNQTLFEDYHSSFKNWIILH